MNNYLQIYTGNGKGKTTASMGLIIRSLGAGKSVFFGQFQKSGSYSEIKMLNKISKLLYPDQILTLEQFGDGSFIVGEPSENVQKLARDGYNRCKEAILSKKYSIVVLDEINIALYYKLISLDDVLKLVEEAKYICELVLTGRYAPQELIDIADLVTSMTEVKHYSQAGLDARLGIEM